MIKVLREYERTDTRVLAALRCLDATTLAPIGTPLVVSAPGTTFVRNLTGLYVVSATRELAAHAPAFHEPPAEPASGTTRIDVEIRDPGGRYLTRTLALMLPRDARPARAGEADSLFRPVDVAMYPGPAAPVTANWVELRVAVRERDTGDALGGALLRVVAGSRVLARGLSDWRGEALVRVAGVPVTTWSSEPGAVVVTEIAAAVECYFDAASGSRVGAVLVRDGSVSGSRPAPDPDAIEHRREALPQAVVPVVLAAGRALAVTVAIALP